MTLCTKLGNMTLLGVSKNAFCSICYHCELIASLVIAIASPMTNAIFTEDACMLRLAVVLMHDDLHMNQMTDF